MHLRIGLQVLVAVLVVAVTPFPSAEAASPIEGVWLCVTQRPGAPASAPTYFTFHGDGTVAYSSGASLSALGFLRRGGGYGEWRKTTNSQWAFRTAELLYNQDGDLAGRLFLESTVARDPATDTLCSGGPTCPSQINKLKITSITVEGEETDVVVILERISSCERFSAGFPSIP